MTRGRKPQHIGCVVEGCERRHKARGYCAMHYNAEPRPRQCHCGGSAVARGLCWRHYQQARRGGALSTSRATRTQKSQVTKLARRITDLDGEQTVLHAKRRFVDQREREIITERERLRQQMAALLAVEPQSEASHA